MVGITRIPKGLYVLLAFSIVAFITLIASGIDIRLTPPNDVVSEHPILSFDATPSLSLATPKTKPRISIIVIYAGNYQPYLNTFFTSFRANSDTVELIWIDIGKGDNRGCLDVSPWAGANGEFNIKTLCYHPRDYWALHRDYFCTRWGCTAEESERVLQEMIRREPDDNIKSAFRLWRGYVFHHLIDPSAEWWGWADPDTFMGSFRSQFPWEANEYDVLIPAHPADMLYMRGHLCFFRSGPQTEAKINHYENLLTLGAYFTKHHPYFAAEEAEYSAFIIRDPSITFLILPQQLVELPERFMRPNTGKFCTLNGVYTMQAPMVLESLPPPFPNFPILAMPNISSIAAPVFTIHGATHPIELIEGTEEKLWIPKETVTKYDIDWALGPWEATRYIGRGGPFAGGSKGVWLRVEPQVPTIEVTAAHDPSIKVQLREGLYVHFFSEKHQAAWYWVLPVEPLEHHQTLATFHEHGAEIWDQKTSKVVWRGP
ncbi:hypothetical protein FRB94_009702 [Tulasnella sp. JGI-2019a]|nr:hypothetical protein FRB93_006858 [Tulasnella sp. JGI-2019a]KAG8994666.1 hypothetical protein FRB94_009702 [Tulasnella sp. JGI-2019a]